MFKHSLFYLYLDNFEYIYKNQEEREYIYELHTIVK